MKRATVRIFDQYLPARDAELVLRRAGLDVKLVTKHAVQVHPAQLERAHEVLAEKLPRLPAVSEELARRSGKV